MLVRRQCLDEIGLFDQRYFAYGDEHDLGARAVRHGWKVVLVWGSIVTNPATRTENSGEVTCLLVTRFFSSMPILVAPRRP